MRRVLPCLAVAGLWLASGQAWADDDHALRIAVIGDQGEPSPQGSQLGATLARLQKDASRRFDAVFFLGDNFYPNGLNGKGWQATRDGVLANFKGLDLPRDAVHAVAGNHDYYAHGGLAPGGFALDGNYHEAAIALWRYHWWWPEERLFDLGRGRAAAVIFLDSAPLVALGPGRHQDLLERLEQRLKATDGPEVRWRVLVMHHPLYTWGEHNCAVGSGLGKKLTRLLGDAQDVCETRYEEYIREVERVITHAGVKVHLVLTGHDHSLQLLDNPGRAPEGSHLARVHVVSGAASKQSKVALAGPGIHTAQDPGRPPLSRAGFLELRVSAGELRLRFLDSGGQPLRMGEACEFVVAAGTDTLRRPQAGEGCPAR